MGLDDGVHGKGRGEVQVGLRCALEIELIVESPRCRIRGKGLELELECTEARLDLVRRRFEVLVGLLLSSDMIEDGHRCLLLVNRCRNPGADARLLPVVSGTLALLGGHQCETPLIGPIAPPGGVEGAPIGVTPFLTRRDRNVR